MRHLISLKEQSKEELLAILNSAQKIKTEYESGILNSALAGKTLIMLFQKPSTRTRLSFEAGMTEMGGHAIYLDTKTTQISMADFKDEIKAIMRMGDVLMMRVLKVQDVELAASLNQVPVIDGCSEKYHPCQALGDIFTMMESARGLNKKIKKVVWLGIENNVSNTLMLACAKLGLDIFIVSPKRHPASLDSELVAQAEATGRVHRTLDFKKAFDGADFIHTDTWLDMEFFDQGQVKLEFKKEYEERAKLFKPYQINAKLLDDFCPQAKIMHCMPMHVGYEITRDAIDHPHSIIFDQAENRKHIQKAILFWLLGHQ